MYLYVVTTVSIFTIALVISVVLIVLMSRLAKIPISNTCQCTTMSNIFLKSYDFGAASLFNDIVLHNDTILTSGEIDSIQSYLSTGTTQGGNNDISFGINGTVDTDFTGSTSVKSTHIQSLNSDFLIVGGGDILLAGAPSEIMLIKYISGGAKVTSFGTSGDGVVLLDTSAVAVDDNGLGAIIPIDNNILVVGDAEPTVPGDTFATYFLLTHNGTLSTEGDFLYAPSTKSTIETGSKMSETEIIVAGKATTAGNDLGIAKLLYDSGAITLDATFGNNGTGAQVIDLGGDFIVSEIAVQSTNKIVVGGTLDGKMLIVRVLENGSGLDITFGVNGFVRFNPDSTGTVEGIAIQKDDTIVFCGQNTGITPASGVVVSLDRDGWRTLSQQTLVVSNTATIFNSCTVNQDCEIFVAGQGNSNSLVAKYGCVE